MERIELQATVREQSGKGPSRRLRAQNMIPAVLYGRREEKPIHLAVDPKALREAMKTPKRLNTILTLKLNSGEERTVLLKEYQSHPVSHDLLHADFIDVRLDQKVVVRVPFKFVGTPAGVKDGGILQTPRREIEVQVLPADMPDSIEIDVSAMDIGSSLHLKDVTFPSGVVPTSRINFTIAALSAPEVEAVTPTAAEAAAAATGAPAAGAAPAGTAPGAAAAAPAAATPAKEEKEKKH
jgi:large subunit ribosomal protein L25